MKKLTFIISILFLSLQALCQDYTGPVPAITDGYGAFGSYEVAMSSFSNPTKGSDKIVSIFYPQDITNPVPTIFYCPGFGITDYEVHLALFNFIASKGYAVVFSPYSSNIFTSYDAKNVEMLNGIITSTEEYPTIIDTTRIGIMGHSFGAGASPWVGKNLFTERNWGESGKFMFLNATWYIRQTEQEDLENFPSDCKFICQVNDLDQTNDHRMSIDLFCTINIPNEEKDFIVIKQDTVQVANEDPYYYYAGHRVLKTDNSEDDSSYDAYDSYGIFRLLDALAVYTFEGDMVAKNVALGNGSQEQISMGETLKPLEVNDSPEPQHPEEFYTIWPCTYTFLGLNPRVDYCDNSCPIVIDINETKLNDAINIYPNPIRDQPLTIDLQNTFSFDFIRIYNSTGILILEEKINQKLVEIPTQFFESGLYIIELKGNSSYFIKLVKE